jgi:hypothetical protein
MAKKVFMSFDFDAGKATLTGMTDEPIIKDIADLSKFEDTWNIIYYFDLPMGDNGEKWTFSWKQWSKKDQEFRLEQYNPFPKNTKLLKPENYKPWSLMASWCYIAYPSCYTVQTDTIYCKKYHNDLSNQYDIVFSVNGKPSIKGWNTTQAVHGKPFSN